MLGMTGFRTLMVPTFLPAYLFSLTGSLLLLSTFVLTSFGLFVLCRFLREPEPPTIRPKMSIRERFRDLPELLALSTSAKTAMAVFGPLGGGLIAMAFGYVPLVSGSRPR